MTRENAKDLLNNLDTVIHFANGGDIYYPLFNHNKIFIKWEKCEKGMILNCIKNYRALPSFEKIILTKSLVFDVITDIKTGEIINDR